MKQTPAESDDDALRAARSRLMKAARARNELPARQAVELVNHHLVRLGHTPISRSHYSNIENGNRSLTEATLRATAAALGIKEAELRNPLADLWAAA